MGRRKQVSDEIVLEIAKTVFVEQGYGASTREIAQRAGISEAVLFQRFKTKIGLFFAAMVPPPPDLSLVADPRQDLAVTEDLASLAMMILRYFRGAMPVLLQLTTHPSFRMADLTDRQNRIPLHTLGEAITACLQRHSARGAITSSRPRILAAALTLYSTLHSLALFERMGVHGGSFPDEAVRNIVSLIVAGLAPQKGKNR